MRKKYAIGIAALVCMIAFVATGCSSDEPAASETTVPVEDMVEETIQEPDEEVIVEEPVVDEDTEEAAVVASYLEIGDTIYFDNGIVTIDDIGIYSQDTWAIMYILIDVTNTSDKNVTIQQTDGTIYVDDYQVASGFDELSEDNVDIIQSDVKINGVDIIIVPMSINPGRKMKYIMFNTINDNMDAAQTVEYEIYGRSVLFKENGKWNYGSENGQSGETDEWGTGGGTSEGGIGNPVIDSNPDRYIPEGISGEIDAIDDGFYADSGNIDLVPGEYYIIGGSNAILTITKDTISMSGGKTNFDNAEIKPAENGSPQYWVYVEGNYYAVVSFFDGGLYFRTDEADSDEDWDEGFYLKF